MGNTRAYGAVSRYLQGSGLVNDLEKYTSRFGKNALVLMDVFFYEDYTKILEEMYSGSEFQVTTQLFGQECTYAEIDRVKEKAIECNADVIIGMGGGKTLDTAKVAADKLDLPVVIIPTIASTDAPCSAMSIIYKENGVSEGIYKLKKNPDIVLVDTEIIIKAPVKFLVAGIGDCLVTTFEARANLLSGSPNYLEGGLKQTLAGIKIAELCYEVLKKDALKAKLSAEKGICTTSFENIVEANILLSGIGFENVGCAGAHSMYYGITRVPGGHEVMHGFGVAYGLFVQLATENQDVELIFELMKFNKDIGLPICLSDLNIEASMENIETMAKGSMSPAWEREPFEVTWELVRDSILYVEALSQEFMKNY